MYELADMFEKVVLPVVFSLLSPSGDLCRAQEQKHQGQVGPFDGDRGAEDDAQSSRLRVHTPDF